jgi:hypothetical protein
MGEAALGQPMAICQHPAADLARVSAVVPAVAVSPICLAADAPARALVLPLARGRALEHCRPAAVDHQAATCKTFSICLPQELDTLVPAGQLLDPLVLQSDWRVVRLPEAPLPHSYTTIRAVGPAPVRGQARATP